MGFFDAIERFDKKYKMSEPCFHLHMETTREIPDEVFTNQNQVKALIEENKRLKQQLQAKRIKAIDTDYKLIE